MDVGAIAVRATLTRRPRRCDRSPMFVEIALLKAKSGDAERLREGLRAARAVIASATGYRGSVFYQGVESPESFILRVEWETLEAHMQGFRQGPRFAEWRSQDRKSTRLNSSHM